MEIQCTEVEQKDKKRVKFGIDRDVENKEVLEFRKNRDERLFEKLYERRTPTIKYLANRYHWLSEDAFSEISVVFVRTVERYGKNGKTTDFNTFFFSSVKNHFSNVAKKKFRNKRTTFDGKDPALRSVQLDSCIDQDGDSQMFHELISNQDQFAASEQDRLEEYVTQLCEGNDFLCAVMMVLLDFTRRQIVRRQHVVSYRCPLISGDLKEDIRTACNIPGDLFEIEEASVHGDDIVCRVSLNTKPLLDYLAVRFSEKRNMAASS